MKILKEMLYGFIDWTNWCVHYRSLKEDYESMKLEIDMSRVYYEKKIEEKNNVIKYLEDKMAEYKEKIKKVKKSARNI